ncbi:GPW/gp25 family protein [Myxococcus sp. CA051A]|uniref:GPW/gp25 family protein n=1 Tax=unclassified Myxococcus TaxID=2648731 RepID=UPI00157AFA61|nr:MULTISPECIES: GPW/gp25 family protein [unclassified Myxococcus]NTX06647.1 GPW/gp25 family protein [Myxococcus sp. CA040A]NTX67262.1 GPW/gp25 family protein [Myxococcus sp. CA051A]
MNTPARPLVSFPLLPVPDERGELHFPTLEASVRQSIEVILRTRPGEQLMRPEFGAGLEEFVGEANVLATRRRIRDLVVDSLARWEPRIDVERVDVLEVDGAPAHARVELVYRLRRTGTVQGLGLTLDLGA